MTEKEICRGCGRNCDLREPKCERGNEYLRTGKLPDRHHEKEHCYAMHRKYEHAEDINDRLIISLRDVSHIMRMQYEGKASQKRILIILSETGAITQKELTERLGIKPGSASEILSKLERAGLIFRMQNETDRRTVDIQLTDAGAELAQEAAGQRRQRHEAMFSCLSSEEKDALLSILEKIRIDCEQNFTGRVANDCRERYGERNHHGKHGRRGDERPHERHARHGE